VPIRLERQIRSAAIVLASIKSAVGRLAEGVANRATEGLEQRLELARRTSPATKVGLRTLSAHYRSLVSQPERLPRYSETGFRIFSQFDEDGIILYFLAVAGAPHARFVEIGAGDGIHASNCASLAFNLGFHGLFVESDEAGVARGRAAYGAHADTRLFPPRFTQTFVTRENALETLANAGFDRDVDVLSIDIDGNDYFIWEALEPVRPRLVVIETHTEHGTRDVLAPYRPDYDWRKADSAEPVGASPFAMTKLAATLGYRLVGGNRFGFNTFYLREDVVDETTIPTIGLDELLRHDRNSGRGGAEPTA
jgi:hypothetical protein